MAFRWFSLVAILASIACGGGNDDCALGRDNLSNVKQTAKLGQTCAIFGYGTCQNAVDTCAEGECMITATGKMCTHTCSRDTDCSGIGVCWEKMCQKPKDCGMFNDGTTNCRYKRDPNNPVECVLDHC